MIEQPVKLKWLTEMLDETWYSLDEITRCQHMLSNSQLYQKVKMLQETQILFGQLKEPFEKTDN